MSRRLRVLALGAIAAGFLVLPAGESFAATTPCPTTPYKRVTSYRYTATNGDIVAGIGGQQRTFNDMTGKVQQGDHLLVNFTIHPSCRDVEVSFVAYKAPDPWYDAARAPMQEVHSSQTGIFTGSGTMEIDVADCYFQTDLVTGKVIQQLGPKGTNNYYTPQGRMVDGANGGEDACTLTGTLPEPPPPVDDGLILFCQVVDPVTGEEVCELIDPDDILLF